MSPSDRVEGSLAVLLSSVEIQHCRLFWQRFAVCSGRSFGKLSNCCLVSFVECNIVSYFSWRSVSLAMWWSRNSAVLADCCTRLKRARDERNERILQNWISNHSSKLTVSTDAISRSMKILEISSRENPSFVSFLKSPASLHSTSLSNISTNLFAIMNEKSCSIWFNRIYILPWFYIHISIDLNVAASYRRQTCILKRSAIGAGMLMSFDVIDITSRDVFTNWVTPARRFASCCCRCRKFRDPTMRSIVTTVHGRETKNDKTK